jgi:hypothetical protein
MNLRNSFANLKRYNVTTLDEPFNETPLLPQ